jgi:hypothetical protein
MNELFIIFKNNYDFWEYKKFKDGEMLPMAIVLMGKEDDVIRNVIELNARGMK